MSPSGWCGSLPENYSNKYLLTKKEEEHLFELILIIVLGIVAVIGLGAAVAKRSGIALIVGGASLVVGVAILFFSSFYTQGVGEAKVIVNFDGTIAGENLDAGAGWKAPTQSSVDFDLFSQEVLYAGGGDATPSYSGGTVSGAEVTVAVGGVSGGSTQANVDISIVYSLDAEAVSGIYKEYKSQERFTKQIVEKTILGTVREVPAQYNAIEFRGEKRAEAGDEMLASLNDKLNKYGVTVDFVNIQDIRFSESVEAALTKIEEANQAVQEAEARQRQKVVDAETKRIEARGVADANGILNQSLTPAVLQQKYIDALGEGTIYVVPEGSTPMVGTK
jgi:regulator of protease activity HflC (stomatin/prohibitin superfamily)